MLFVLQAALPIFVVPVSNTMVISYLFASYAITKIGILLHPELLQLFATE